MYMAGLVSRSVFTLSLYQISMVLCLSHPKCLGDSAQRAINVTVGLATSNLTHMNRMLQLMYDINGTQEMEGSLIPGGNESDGTVTCYRMLPKLMEFVDTGFSYIHIPEENRLLAQSRLRLLVGDYLSSLEGYTAAYGLLYFVTTPLPYFFEDYHHGNRGNWSKIISAWPSYWMYANAMRLFVDLTLTNQPNDQRVLLLTHAASVDGLNYVTMLESVIGNHSYREVYTHDIWREVQQMRMEMDSLRRSREYHKIMTKLRTKLKEKKINLIVVYLDMKTEDKLRAFESLFSKGADLDDDSIPWLIADMSLPFMPGALERLKKLDVLRTKVYLPVVWGNEQFFIKNVIVLKRVKELLYEGVEGMGVQQISYIMEKVVGRVAPTKIENKHDFFEEMDKFIKMKESNYTSLELMGYPRNVIISFSRIAPYEPDPYTDFNETGAIRAVFVRPQSLPHVPVPNGLELTKLKNYTVADYQLIGLLPKKEILPQALIVLDKPFAYQRRDGTFEGLVIDIFNDIDRILMSEGIFMNLKLRPTEGYGSKTDGNWSDTLGEMREPHNVLALGQFSITDERREDFDFSNSFGYIGYTYIVSKTIKFNTFLQFTKPFTSEVWICLCVAMLIAAMFIYLVELWNPYGDEIPDEQKFTLKESIWYSYLTVSQAGADFGANSTPARIFSIFYWFFALVVVGCYTGNLASFLTESILERPAIDLNHLMSSPHSQYEYGYLANSTAADFYRELIRENTGGLERPGELVKTYEEGIEKVRNGTFVLLGTSTVLKWYENNDPDCALSMHEAPFYSRGMHEIAFVMQKNWDHREAVNRAMQHIRESGRLQRIFHRWVNFAGECLQKDDDGEQVSLAFHHFSGLMVLLAVAIAASFICLAIKLIHLKRRDSMPSDDSSAAPATEANDPEQIPLRKIDAGGNGETTEIV